MTEINQFCCAVAQNTVQANAMLIHYKRLIFRTLTTDKACEGLSEEG